MARPDKVAVVDEVRERLERSSATLLTEYRGLTVTELARLRAELRKAGAEYKVVKNTLTRIAARDAGYDVPDSVLTGPTAITFVAEDPIATAKVLRAFSREHPQLVVKGGILEGNVLDAADTLRLADLETREELLSRLAGLFEAVLAQPARLAAANLSKAARVFGALMAKREEAGETAPPPEPDSPAAEAAVAEAEATEGVDATPPPGGDEPAEDEAAPETADDTTA
jgi:large subunit ribosomal protein L10